MVILNLMSPSPQYLMGGGTDRGAGGAWGKQEAGEDLALKPLLRRQSPPICPAQPPSPVLRKSV